MSGGGSVPKEQATAADWVNMVNEFQKACLSTRLGIPMIYGIDAVHGHNNVYNATIFPHNVGLGATRQVYSRILTYMVFELTSPLIRLECISQNVAIWVLFKPLFLYNFGVQFCKCYLQLLVN